MTRHERCIGKCKLHMPYLVSEFNVLLAIFFASYIFEREKKVQSMKSVISANFAI